MEQECVVAVSVPAPKISKADRQSRRGSRVGVELRRSGGSAALGCESFYFTKYER